MNAVCVEINMNEKTVSVTPRLMTTPTAVINAVYPQWQGVEPISTTKILTFLIFLLSAVTKGKLYVQTRNGVQNVKTINDRINLNDN